jgi:hypothetical protein
MSDATRARKRATAAAAATAAVGSVAAPAVLPASADARRPAETCPGYTLCLWEKKDFNLPVNWSHPLGANNDFAGYTYSSDHSVSLNNSVSSVWNNSDRWIKLCQNPYCTTPIQEPRGLCIAPGVALRDLSIAGVYFGQPVDNNTSSQYTYTLEPGPTDCYTRATGPQGCSL